MGSRKLIVGEKYFFTLGEQHAVYLGLQRKPDPGMKPRHIFEIKGEKIPLTDKSVNLWIKKTF